MMEAKRWASVAVAILLVAGIAECDSRNGDLETEETSPGRVKNHKYSSRTENKYAPPNEPEFGLRTVSIRKKNESSDFRTREKSHFRENEISSEEKRKDMETAGSANGNGNGKQKKETSKKDEDDEEKTLAQQVADGKYGLIQNEIFANGSKRPGILSYLSNSEVPKDTKENFGGLEKDEIWLAEDHVLVLRGGRYPEGKEKESSSSTVWPPIDDYAAPPRQVKIPENPKIPPPFPVRLRENGPLEFVGGENGTSGVPPFPPPFPFRPNESLPFPFPVPFPRSPDEAPNGTFPLPFPFPPGPLPPFPPGNFPPGAAFLPPPGNLTDFDEDDPSVYYPPKYDFYYPQDNATAVPPGPLVPGIILPPPPDFFAPLENETDARAPDEENETDGDFKSSTETPYVGPDYLPVPRKPPSKHRGFKRPSDSSRFYSSTSPRPEKQTVTYVYPENVERKPKTTSSPLDSFRTTKVADSGSNDERIPEGFSSPIYVPEGGNGFVYHPLPTTSPKPNHITIPTTKSLTKEIYIVTTPEADNQNRIEDSYQSSKTSKPNKYESLSPEIHPLRSLIRPNVSVSYVGKYGHLPASTPFPYPKRLKPSRDEAGAIRGGHYITRAPDPAHNSVSTPATTIGEITVTPVPVKKIRIRPVVSESTDSVTPSSNPSKATFYFYEEPPATENPGRILGTSAVPQRETSTETPPTYVKRPELETESPPKYYYSSGAFGKTPIRQFLEETFHSSNVLPNKPHISHVDHAGIIKHGYYSPDVPKMKHLNYGSPIAAKPVKYHYVRDEESATIPYHKIKALQVENSGSSGLQTVGPVNSGLSPYEIRRPLTSTQRPEKTTVSSVESTTASVPLDYRNTDPPFVPSNYYATARPEHLHFTPQDHTLVDEITKNYFTIFGQKINSASTTPLAPVQTYRPRPIQTSVRPEPVKFYKTENNNFLQIVTTSPRPQSNFEQYLKEITGQDHKDYIVSNVYPTKTKKGKGYLPNGVPPRLHSPESVFLQPLKQIYFRDETQPPLPQPQSQQQQQQQQQQPPSPSSSPVKARYPYRGFVEKPSFVYGPSFSTTLRPVVDVEIRPQYLQHVSSTSGPFESIRRPPENLRFNHNFGQYLREITSPESIKIETGSHLDYFSTTPSPDYSPTPKPPSLEGDILINYKPQRPEINPEAETIDVGNPIPAFASGSNFKIVDPPDLSLHRNRVPYRATYDPKPPQGFDPTKDFFENLPKSGYFSPSHGSTGNSFISYNLPGNGGHFYFLTPQIVDKFQQDEQTQPQPDRYRTVKRNEDRLRGQRKGSESRYSSQNHQNTRHGYSAPDYLRRRRKKP